MAFLCNRTSRVKSPRLIHGWKSMSPRVPRSPTVVLLKHGSQRPSAGLLVNNKHFPSLCSRSHPSAAWQQQEFVKLVSAEGAEFWVDRKCAMVSGTIKAMLSGEEYNTHAGRESAESSSPP